MGSILDGSYRIVKRLGAGGMAVVYEAIELSLQRRVAIKVLNQHFRSNADYRARFRNEATIAARIEHPNLVWIYQCRVEADGLPYIVMELLRGRDLREEFKLVGAMDWRRSARIVIQLCTALDAAHRRNVIHRDVKPANCFLCHQEESGGAELPAQPDQLKLLDLGIAKLSGDIESFEVTSPKTKEGHVLGTWPYMAPEQLTQKPVFQTDLYAVGAVLYRLITGRHPIERQGSNDLEYQTRILFELPRPPTDFVPDLPSELDELILRALAKSTEDRPQSALEVRGALERLLAADVARDGVSEARPPLQVLFYTVTVLGGLSFIAALIMLYSITGVAGITGITGDARGRSSSEVRASAAAPGAHNGGATEGDETGPGASSSGSASATTTGGGGVSGPEGAANGRITGDETTSGSETMMVVVEDYEATTRTAGAELVATTSRGASYLPGADERYLLTKAIRGAKLKLQACDSNPFPRTLTVVMTVQSSAGSGPASVRKVTVTKAIIDKMTVPLDRLQPVVACVEQRLSGLALPGVEVGGIFKHIRVPIR